MDVRTVRRSLAPLLALAALIGPAAAGATAPARPAVVSNPTLSGSSAPAGSAYTGDTLTCAPGRWTGDGIAYSFRWVYLWDRTPLAGETTPSHTVTAADVGHRLGCEVTATNARGSRQALVSASVLAGPPANTAAPAIGGTIQAGGTATCLPGAWSNAPSGWSMRWFLDGAQVATGASLVLTEAYQGHRVSCDVAAIWSGGTTAPVASAAVAVPFPPPASVVAPSITGNPTPAGTLACATGTWRHADSYAIAWLRDGAPVDDAAVHTVSTADSGHRLSCRVTATGPGGSVAAESDAVVAAAPTWATPAVNGSARADRLTGGAAAEVIRGGAGADRLSGRGGNDRLVGGPGRDRLDGGAGNDILDARDHHGGDVVHCGSGRDRALVNRGDRVSRDCESVRRAR